MPNDARRKEQKRLKREKKKAVLRRETASSPYKRIGERGQLEACYINAGWREAGMASLYVIRRHPDGGHAMACFLIDVWCAGLKDAWGAIDLLREDIDHNLEHARQQAALERIELDDARKLLAGAIRFARQNGFRLPPHYDRWLNLVGGVGDVNNADLSSFGKDGGLLWTGPMDDLRRRLVACTPEEFINRPGVKFITEAEGEDFVGEEHDDADPVDAYRTFLEEAPKSMVNAFREILAEWGEQPHPRLEDSVRLLLAADLARNADKHDEPAPRIAADELMHNIFGGDPPQQLPSDLNAAVQQASRCREVLASMLGQADIRTIESGDSPTD